MTKRICCIFNLAPHYRAPIYNLMDKELQCDFYFGDKVGTPIKIMDVENLVGFKKTVKNKNILKTGWIWQFGVWQLIFKPYKYYILTGDPYIITNHIIALLALLLNKKVFVWSHGMKGYANPKRKVLERFFYRLCHKTLLYGDYAKTIMIKEGFKEDSLIPIYNSLDYDEQKQIQTKLKTTNIYKDYFKNNNPVLIYIGRIQKSKRLDLLIESLKELRKEKKYYNLIIIGKDVENNKLEAIVKNNNLEKQVWFYGSCYEEDKIGELLHNADLCVSPGPIGLTALHAMTYGTPIITNDNFDRQMPEFEVIEKNSTGDFFIENDLSDLTSKIKNWISSNTNKRETVRKNAYSIIDQKYNPHYQIKVLKELTKLK